MRTLAHSAQQTLYLSVGAFVYEELELKCHQTKRAAFTDVPRRQYSASDAKRCGTTRRSIRRLLQAPQEALLAANGASLKSFKVCSRSIQVFEI